MFRHQKKKKKKQKKKLTSTRDKLEFQPRRCIKPRKKKSILPVEKSARDPSIFRTIDETATRWYPNGVKNSGNRHSRGSRWLEKSTLESGANRLSARFEHRYRIQIINHCRRCGVIERGTFSRRRSRGRSILIPRIESVRRLSVGPTNARISLFAFHSPFVRQLFNPCSVSLLSKETKRTTDSPHFDSSPSPSTLPCLTLTSYRATLPTTR